MANIDPHIDRAIATAIADTDIARVVWDICNKMIAGKDVAPYLPYMFQTVDEAIIPYLLEQMSAEVILPLINEMPDKRQLLMQIIPLFRTLGTRAAIDKVLALVGVTAQINEHTDTGNPDTDWARCSLVFDVSGGFDPAFLPRLVSLIELSKAERCTFNYIGEIDLELRMFQGSKGGDDLYTDGTIYADGTYTIGEGRAITPLTIEIEVSSEAAIHFPVVVDDNSAYVIDENNNAVTTQITIIN